MAIHILDALNRLSNVEMERLMEKVFSLYNQPFEILSIEKLSAGSNKLVLVRLQNGLQEKVVV